MPKAKKTEKVSSGEFGFPKDFGASKNKAKMAVAVKGKSGKSKKAC